MMKYACKKCITETIFLLRSGCFSMRIVSAVSTQGRASRWLRRDTYTPSACCGGIPSTSHCLTRFQVLSSRRQRAKFFVPTSILKIIGIKDIHSFKSIRETEGYSRLVYNWVMIHTSWNE